MSAAALLGPAQAQDAQPAEDPAQACAAERDALAREVEFRRAMHRAAVEELAVLRDAAPACTPVATPAPAATTPSAAADLRPPEAAQVETAVERVRERLAELDEALARVAPDGQR